VCVLFDSPKKETREKQKSLCFVRSTKKDKRKKERKKINQATEPKATAQHSTRPVSSFVFLFATCAVVGVNRPQTKNETQQHNIILV